MTTSYIVQNTVTTPVPLDAQETKNGSMNRYAILLSEPFKNRQETLTLEQVYFLLYHIRSQIPMPCKTSQLNSLPTGIFSSFSSIFFAFLFTIVLPCFHDHFSVGSVFIIRVDIPNAQDQDGYAWKHTPLFKLAEIHTTSSKMIEIIEDGNGWMIGDSDSPCISRIRYRLPGSPSNEIQVVHYLPPLLGNPFIIHDLLWPRSSFICSIFR